MIAKPQLNRWRARLTASDAQLRIELKRRKAAEMKLEQYLRHLSRELLSAQEEECNTISRGLHDDIAQTLMSINVHLANLKIEAAVNIKGLAKTITSTQLIVKKSVEIVHRPRHRYRGTDPFQPRHGE